MTKYEIIKNKENQITTGSEYEKQNKNKIMINNPDFQIFKVDLDSHFIESKKHKKRENNSDKENIILKDFNSIFNYSFESDKTLSDKSDLDSFSI